MQTNLASTYSLLGREEEALSLRKEVYSGRVKLDGDESERTLRAANNYVASLVNPRVGRFEEAKRLMRKTMPMARRVLGDVHALTFMMRKLFGEALYRDNGAALDDVREAVSTLEETERTARRVLGGSYPNVREIQKSLRVAREVLRARETPSPAESA